MTDKEIIKAFEYCLNDRCEGCPYAGKCFYVENSIWDLAKRQQTKIKALKMDKEQLESDISNALGNLDHMTQLYEGAIKEFADKLKEEINQAIYTYYNHSAGGYYLAENCIDEIDNLVKEMVGDGNGNL